MAVEWAAIKAELTAIEAQMEAELRADLSAQLAAQHETLMAGLHEEIEMQMDMVRREQEEQALTALSQFADQSMAAESRIRRVEVVADRLESNVHLLLDGIGTSTAMHNALLSSLA
eukprot:c47042_g1_i1.p2 GENE.c47042_g1_i1~~c47042_g1_i1.p2  ORF type:complete len:116 (-),score=33.53 c47042_g1_i1:39-386(-)